MKGGVVHVAEFCEERKKTQVLKMTLEERNSKCSEESQFLAQRGDTNVSVKGAKDPHKLVK